MGGRACRLLPLLSHSIVYSTGHDEVSEAVFKKKKVTRRFTNTVLTTMFSILGIFAVAFIILFGTKYYQASKRDAY